MLASEAGTRSLPWSDFLVGPKRTAITDDEVIVEARWAGHRHVGTFSKIGPRNALAIAVASVTLVLDEDTRQVAVALGAVGPTVLRCPDAEAFAADALTAASVWDDPAAPLAPVVIDGFGSLVAAAARPIDDLRATATYRRHACRVLATRALGWLLAERQACPARAA